MDFIKESYTDEMKQKYDEYLINHISNVQKGFKYLCDNHIIELDLIKATFPKIEEQIRNHDQSKYSKEEYDPYVEYFYGEKDEKGEVYPDVQDRFDEAWNHHQKRNPHHWQYWLLREDDGDFKCIHMDYNYIIEMVCDWWAFSWKQNNLYEIFTWYEENKPKMQMHKNTIRDLEELLKQIKTQLDLDKSEGDYSSKDLNESTAQFALLDKNERKYVDFINKQTKFGYVDSSGNYHTKSYGTDSVVFSADEFEKNKTGSCLVRAIYLKEKLGKGKVIGILDRKNKFGHFVFVNNDNIAIDPKYGSFTAASDEAIKNFYKINNPDFIGEVNADTLIGVKYSNLWDTILNKTNNLSESSQSIMIKELEDAGYKYKWDKYSPEQIFRIHQKNVLDPKPKKEVKEEKNIELPEYRIINGEKHILTDGGTYIKVDDDHFEESIRNESEDTFVLNAMEHVLDVFDSNACDMAMRGLKRKFEKKFNLTEEEWERYDKVAMKRWYIKNYGEERWKRHVDSIKQDLDTDIEPQEEDNKEFFNNN